MWVGRGGSSRNADVIPDQTKKHTARWPHTSWCKFTRLKTNNITVGIMSMMCRRLTKFSQKLEICANWLDSQHCWLINQIKGLQKFTIHRGGEQSCNWKILRKVKRGGPRTLRRKWQNKWAWWALFWYPYFERFSSLSNLWDPKEEHSATYFYKRPGLLRSSEKWKFQDRALESV